jgi:hypothetical protein
MLAISAGSRRTRASGDPLSADQVGDDAVGEVDAVK